MNPYILGIESSCDDTSAAVVHGDFLLSNVIANQDIHKSFGGVVPEYASRAHQQNIIPVVEEALQLAKIQKKQIQAIAYTRGPGLLGSLLVGASFAKAFALGLGIPLLAVDHLEAHILAHFIREEDEKPRPAFPFLCLVVSGGHTQIVLVKAPFEHEILGRTIDDAAGEAFDKAAKILGLPYPGGVIVDQLASSGNPQAFKFSQPSVPGLNFSFSGLKTSFLYFVRDRLREDPDFIGKHLNDLCASVQEAITGLLVSRVFAAARQYGISDIAFSGGVSANSGLRKHAQAEARLEGHQVFFQKPEFCTDNAAMIAVAGWFRFQEAGFSGQQDAPYARKQIKPVQDGPEI